MRITHRRRHLLAAILAAAVVAGCTPSEATPEPTIGRPTPKAQDRKSVV